jgi:ABC-type dipeptide/oligopeptide/nickel transport system permease subunit
MRKPQTNIPPGISGRFKNFFFGYPSGYDMIPILDSFKLKKDFMYVFVYKGKNTGPEMRKYYYMDILRLDSMIKTGIVDNGDSDLITKDTGEYVYHFTPPRYMHNKSRQNTDTDTFVSLNAIASKMRSGALSLRQVKTDTTEYDRFCTRIRKEVYQLNLSPRRYWLGTDRFGRDILSRLIIGSRISLFVGLISVLISLFIGIISGALAGYFRGRTDAVILWIINVFWSIPTVLLAMGLYVGAGTLIPSKLLLIFIAVGLTMWVEVARIVRGQFILVREFEYVTAAQSLGYGHIRTIFIHILPNIMGPVIVVACANFANAILIESGLSYIGLGVQPPTPSWGGMLSEYKNFIDSDKAYLALAPGLAIMLLVLAFNLVGNGLRDALDVKGKAE